MRIGSLFSGIGGLELGLEWAGMQTLWQVERDPYALKVLEKNWPTVERYTDVRQFNAADAARVDVICGGFPCQPHSVAGKRKASGDERDLWGEFTRVIREAKPRWVVAENVTGLLSSEAGRYFGGVLRDLASLGFDAEWFVLSAGSVGAPHRRDRLFIVANSNGERRQELNTAGQPSKKGWDSRIPVAHWGKPRFGDKPSLDRISYGVPRRVDRLRCLGNAVVPQVAYEIGKRIMDREAQLG